ncbi:MAG: trypsin-like serine protease [Silicimonas sp.]|nr:trypsin-like serine protease [Silicimonas sp.]
MLFRTFLVALCFATPLSASQIGAVGRIENTVTNGSCSGVLVAPDLVLSAAHCIGPENPTYAFRPGDGQITRVRHTLTRVFQHPMYGITKDRTLWRLRFDLAIGQLEAPVPAARATPIPPGPEAQVGETLFIVSWRRDGTTKPRQRACEVIKGMRGLVTLGCRVEGGESGAPVLRKTEDGLELVAIISSRANLLQQPIAQASDVALRLPPLLDLINAPED